MVVNLPQEVLHMWGKMSGLYPDGLAVDPAPQSSELCHWVTKNPTASSLSDQLGNRGSGGIKQDRGAVPRQHSTLHIAGV